MIDDMRWVRFDEFELDLSTGDLVAADGPVALQPLPARVLALLVSNPGVVVTRNEIKQQVWGEVTFAADQALNTCIRQVRIALADSAGDPRFVATVPRRGYRFLAEVARSEGPGGFAEAGVGEANPSPGHSPVVADEPGRAGRALSPRWLAAAVVAVVIAIIGIDQLAGSRGTGQGAAIRTAAGLPLEIRLEYLKARELLDGTDSVAWRKSSAAFDTVRMQRPDFVPATSGAAHAALLLGEFERAAGLATWAIAADSASGEAHMVLGTTLLRRGAWDEARLALDRARKLTPGLVASYTGLAVLAALDGRLDSALALAEISVDVDPMSSITVGDAGYVALWADRPERAIEWCGHARDLRPDWHMPRYCLLDAHHALGQQTAERDEAVGIMEALGADAGAVSSVAGAPPAEGLRRYRSWQRQRLDPGGETSPQFAGYLAFLRMQDGETDAAVRLLEVVAASDPVRLQLTLLDPVFEPLREDPRLSADLE